MASGFKHTRPSSTCAVKTSSFVALISLLLNLRRCIIHLYLLVNSYETFDDIKPKLRCAYRCKSFQTAKRGEVCRIPGCSVSPAAPGTPTPVRLPQAPPETFKQFLLYVYTGKVRIWCRLCICWCLFFYSLRFCSKTAEFLKCWR